MLLKTLCNYQWQTDVQDGLYYFKQLKFSQYIKILDWKFELTMEEEKMKKRDSLTAYQSVRMEIFRIDIS